MKHDNSYSYKPQYDPFENVMTRNGLHADEVISALQKSIRHADEDTAIRCGYEMYVTSMELENYLGDVFPSSAWKTSDSGSRPRPF